MTVKVKEGCHIFKGNDGKWWVIDQNEKASSANIPDEVVDSFFKQPLDGSLEQNLLRQALEEKQILQEATPRAKPLTVAIDAQEDLQAELSKVLSEMNPTTRSIPFQSLVAGEHEIDIVISFTRHQQDRYHQALEEELWTHKIPMMRICREGKFISISPIKLSESEAGYKDLRARRLAASTIREPLSWLWERLNGEVDRDLKLNYATRLALLSQVAHIVNALSQNDRNNLNTNTEICINEQNLEIVKNPVLPLPRNIARKSEIKHAFKDRPSN